MVVVMSDEDYSDSVGDDSAASDSDDNALSDSCDTQKRQLSSADTKTKGEPAKKKAKSKNAGIKSGEEVRALTEYQTDVATLQINDILNDVALSDAKRQQALLWIGRVKEVLQSSGSIGKKQASEVSLPMTAKCAFEDPQLADFKFSAPTNVYLVGSLAYGTAVTSSAIDVAVEMPKECFAKWDYHNLRYHRRRALYLTYLAAALRKVPSIHSRLEWFVDGDQRSPSLLVTSADTQWKAHILPYPAPEVFKLARFAVDKFNLQEKYVGAGTRTSVPIYNGSILRDMLLVPSMQSLKEQFSLSVGIRQGVQILKSWQQTRSLSEGFDRFGTFELTLYVSHLLHDGRLSYTMGAYQVVRAVLAQLQSEDWTAQRLLGSSPADAGESGNTHRLLKEIGSPAILLDPSGYHNYLYRVSPSTIALLKQEARIALQSMNSGSVTLINELFSVRLPFHRKFDCYARIDFDECPAALHRLDKWTLADYGGSVLWPTTNQIMSTLRRAFGRRVSALVARPCGPSRWPITGAVPDEPNAIDIGWDLEPDENQRVDKGPPADSEEANEFRQFWGEKSEIRRFQDGSILETVVWPGDTSEERKRITQSICKFILSRHHGVDGGFTFVGESCDRALELPRCMFKPRYGMGDEQMIDVNLKYNELAKALRAIKNLPLEISSVSGLSDELCYTAVFPTVGTACDTDASLVTLSGSRRVPQSHKAVPKLVKPIDILLVMESSSKWPDNVDAIQNIKTAFYSALAARLDATTQTQVFADHLLVLFKGLVFRIRISCPKEIILSKQVQPEAQEGMVRICDNASSQRLEFEFVVRPKIISALHGVHSQNPTFGTACRLAKRWLSSHLLYDAVDPLAVDLIVASLYINPLPFSEPHSARAAFQRFLHKMAYFDWRLNPLVVNFNGQFDSSACQKIVTHFTRNRQALPAMYIRTPYDQRETSFITSERPIAPVIHRIITLAKKCLDNFEQQLATGHSGLAVFHGSTEPYDFVIKLNERCVANHYMNRDAKTRLSFKKGHEEIPVVDFDPVRLYVDELKVAYGHLCLFFYDAFGGTEIGGLWIPKAQKPLPFRVHNVNGRRLLDNTKVLTPNYTAILADFKVIGTGLVKEVVEQKYPSNRTRKDSR